LRSFRDEDKATPIESIKTALQTLFSFRSKMARRTALNAAMSGSELSEEEKADLKEEYLIRESTAAKKKTEKMSVKDFEMLKVLGIILFAMIHILLFVFRAWWIWISPISSRKSHRGNLCNEISC
jgi:predicted RND superfamily exporter protein